MRDNRTREIKTLKEVSEEINENVGGIKIFNTSNGYFPMSLRTGQRPIRLSETKIRTDLSFKGTKQPISFGYFKSKKGYNSKYKNNKEFADHYGEYIAYIILKQLGKKACKVDIGKLEMKNPYSNKPMQIDGILSHFQLSQQEIFVPAKLVIEDYKMAHPKKYREMIGKEDVNFERNYTNIEIILLAMEDYFRRNGQEAKIPEARKRFFDMCIFDIRFGNRDRHDENFGFRVNQETEQIEFYHLFDNEQILGMQENRPDIEKYLSDEKLYAKFKERELTSYIGIPGATQRINPMLLLSYLLEKYPEETKDSIADIGRYKASDLEELLGYFPDLSNEHKEFAKKIFSERELEMQAVIEASKKMKKKDEEPSL